MRRAFILICILLTTATATAQFGSQRQNRNNRQPPQPPTENEKERMRKKSAERKKEIVANFLTTLAADEFVKEIATQTFDEYFTKVETFLKIPYGSLIERKEAFETFRDAHFKELKFLLSESDSKKIDEFFEGNFEESEVKKKRRKENKKKKNKDDDN